MASITITLTDIADGTVDVRMVGDPPIESGQPIATTAQRYGVILMETLGEIATVEEVGIPH